MSFTHNRIAAYFGRTNLGVFRSKCDAYQIVSKSKVGLAAFVTIWQVPPQRSLRNYRNGRKKLG